MKFSQIRKGDYKYEKSLAKFSSKGNWGKIKATVKDDVSDYIWKDMKRTPVILPIIMEV